MHHQPNPLFKPMQLRLRFVEANVAVCLAIVLAIGCVTIARRSSTSTTTIELMAYLIHHFETHCVKLIQNSKLVLRRVSEEAVNHALVDSLRSLTMHNVLWQHATFRQVCQNRYAKKQAMLNMTNLR